MELPNLKFKDKTILITGASGGIGSETARLFAEEGANIVINYYESKNKAEKLLEEIKEIGSEGIVIKADVSKEKEIELMIDKAINRFKKINVLINNAAKHPPPMFIFKQPDWKLWDRMYQVNVKGILLCSYYVAPFLKETQGNIVNVIMDYKPGGLGYLLTKNTGTPLTRGLAKELSPIRVNAVSPDAIDTWGMTEEEKEYHINRTLVKRVGNPNDIANAILFLASDKASFITGETIHVDGGKQIN